MDFRIGIVGCGAITHSHVNALKRTNMILAAGTDVMAVARSRFAEANRVPVFAEVGEMIDQVAVDGVIVCTPPNMRVDIVERCLARSIPVLCEKPLAHTLADAQRLALMAREAQVPCFVAYCHRFTPAVNRMRQMIESGLLGEPIFFRNAFGGYMPERAAHWMSDRTVSGGGVLIDNASHSLDLFMFFCGPIDLETVACSQRNSWAGRGDDCSFLQLHAQGGTSAHIAVGWLFPLPMAEVELLAARGAIRYDYLRPRELKIRMLGDGDWRIEEVLDAEHRFVLQLHAFRAAIGGEKTILANFEDGLRVAQTIDVCMGDGEKGM
jgi:predicted dehydrogenase